MSRSRDVAGGHDAEGLAEHIAGLLDDVTVVVASESIGAPEVAWGDRFLYHEPGGVQTARTHPFATIVVSDYPGFDEASELDRPGIYRLNISIGRAELAKRYPTPDQGLDVAALDFAALDVVMAHPVYRTHGWVCVLNPSSPRMPEVEDLLAVAHARAARRDDARGGRRG